MESLSKQELIDQMRLLFDPPSKLINKRMDNINKHTKSFFEYVDPHGNLVFESSVELLQELSSDGIILCNSYHRKVQISLIRCSLEHIFSSYILMSNGLYASSFALLRSVFETQFRIFFISYYGSDGDPNIVFGKITTATSKARFAIIDFLETELKMPHRKSIYEYLSKHAHSNTLETMQYVIKHPNDQIPSEIEIYFNILFLVLYSIERFILEILLKEDQTSIKDQNLYKKLELTVQVLKRIIQNTEPGKNDNYQDISNMLTILKSKDDLD